MARWVTDFGAVANDDADDSAAFQAAVDSAPAHTSVVVPAGEYVLEQSLRMRSGVALRGAGAAQTALLIDHDDDAVVFRASGKAADSWVPVLSGLEVGSDRLVVADSSPFEADGFGIIRQDNDPNLMVTRKDWRRRWARAVVGQVFRITAVEDDNVLRLAEPLNLDFRKALKPRVRAQVMIRDAGIQGLRLRRRGENDAYTVYIRGGANIWLDDIISERTAKAHVFASRSYRCEVRDSIFTDATDFGAGGHGYGVYLADQTTACLVANNGFRRLRHAMIVSRGANGNVFAHNRSRQPQAETDYTPADISLHGHFPFANLFEGNSVNNIHISDYWGPSGPGNLFFRNRIKAGNLRVDDYSNGQLLVANELMQGEIRIDETVDVATMTVDEKNTDIGSPLPASCYLKQ